MPIAAFDNEEEVLALANDTIYGLGGSVFTKDMKKAMKFTNELDCGSVVINGSSYFRSFEMPFSGFKYSGVGSEGVFSTFDELTQVKCITLKGGNAFCSLRLFPVFYCEAVFPDRSHAAKVP